MRRKVVISTAGSLGDLYPFIAFALELKRRGYEPLIASQVEYRAKIEAEGITPLQFMLDVLRDAEKPFEDRQWAAQRHCPRLHPSAHTPPCPVPG